MKKLSKLIITQMNIRQIPCYVCAYEEDGKVMELRFEPVGEKSSLGNIYVGQIENIAANIGAAFVQISAGEKCYLQLSDAPLLYRMSRVSLCKVFIILPWSTPIAIRSATA